MQKLTALLTLHFFNSRAESNICGIYSIMTQAIISHSYSKPKILGL